MKHLMNAMNIYGDGEEDEGVFDPEEFFSIGGTTQPTYENPFSEQNLEKVSEQISEEKVNDAQSLNLSAVSSISLTEQETTTKIETPSQQEEEPIKLQTEESESTIKDEHLPVREIMPNNRFNSFEEVKEPNGGTTVISVKKEEQSKVELFDKTPNTNTSLSLDLTDVDEDLVIDSPVEKGDFENLETIAERKEGKEILDLMESSKRTIVADEVNIIIEDDDESDLEFNSDLNNPSIGNIFSQTQQPSQQPLQQPSQQPLQQPSQQSPQQQVLQQLNNQQPTNTQPLLTELPVFDSKFGPKLREVQEVAHNEYMLNLNEFKDGEEVIGEGFVETAKVLTYGGGKKRVEYNVIINKSARLTITQFSVPNHFTDEHIQPIIGTVLMFEGKWNLFQNKRSMVANTISEAVHTKREDYFKNDNTLQLFEDWLNVLINKIRKPWVKNLLTDILFNDGYITKMKNTPAALSNHDTSKQGLFLHTMKVTMIAYQTSLLYPTVDTDVVIASSLLHDIGKVHEIGESTYTDLGITTGHIVTGYSLVRDKISAMVSSGVNIDDRVALNILHCILAHHGKLEWGSPVTPKTREANILHLADMTDANLTHMDESLSGGVYREFSKMYKHDILDLNIY